MMRVLLPIACFLFLTKIAASGSSLISNLDSSDQEERCEEITIPMCLGIGYNLTRMPNELNHETQEEAGLEVHQFWPLVEIKCSADLKFFLCSMYVPICLPGYKKPLPPCQGLCRRAREGCEPIMTQYGFKWPERMDCDKFPVLGASQDQLCMDETNTSSSSSTTTKAPRIKPPKPCRGSKNCTNPPPGDSIGGGRKGGSNSMNNNNLHNNLNNNNNRLDCKCQCQHPLVSLGRADSLQTSPAQLLNLSVGGIANCAYPCKETYFKPEEKEFANVWITLWSSLCAASTLMTLTTFFIETERFKYPERPIVFLSACYFLVSVGYLIRVVVGHEAVACDGLTIRYSSTGANLCSLVFLLVYFFGMASSIWWVVLSFTWFLAAGLKWGNEAIASYAQYFHLAAWLVPTLQTIGVLLAGAVDGDPVSGICYVGNMNMDNLRKYVLAPLGIYLVVGTTFLVAGFVSLFRIRNVIRKQAGPGAGSKADKLEKLMIRIGIFSVLYTVPATILIGCHVYENAFHDSWMRSAACTCSESRIVVAKSRPLYSVLMLKYFMALAVGITSGVWIWSGKTLDSWRRLWRRLFGRPDPHGANAVLIKNRPGGASLVVGGKPPPQYVVAGPGSASLLGPHTGSSVTSASQHHLHHHSILNKQHNHQGPPLSHV